MAEGVEVSWCAETVERRREKAKRGAARMTIEGVGFLETLRWGWLVLVRRVGWSGSFSLCLSTRGSAESVGEV